MKHSIRIVFALCSVWFFHLNAIADSWQDYAQDFVPSNIGNNGTASAPYIISTPAHLAYMAQQVNAGTTNYQGVYFKLGSNLNLTGHDWEPIGTYEGSEFQATRSKVFQGIFDGNNLTVSNIKITTEYHGMHAGLFGSLFNGAQIKNLNLQGQVDGYTYVGAIAGSAYCISSGKDSVIIQNCTNSAKVEGHGSSNYRVGGIVGYVLASGSASGYTKIVIKNCTNNASISALVNNDTNVGGIMGYGCGFGYDNQGRAIVQIINCDNAGPVKGGLNSVAGGIIGYTIAQNASIDENGYGLVIIGGCYNYGEIKGGKASGGIVGWGLETIPSNSSGYQNNSEIYIGQCFNSGNITNESNSENHIGGIIGRMQGYASIELCLNEGDIYTNEMIISSAGGIAGTCEAVSGSETLENNINNGSVNGRSSGGIAGFGIEKFQMLACINNGKVSGSQTAGLLGTGTGNVKIKESVNTGTVTGILWLGGIVSIMDNNTAASVVNCVNNGMLKKSATGGEALIVGGIVGECKGGATIINSYNYASVCNGQSTGGICGKIASAGNISSCYFLQDGNINSGLKGINGQNVAGTVPYKLTDFKNQTNFVGWTFAESSGGWIYLDADKSSPWPYNVTRFTNTAIIRPVAGATLSGSNPTSGMFELIRIHTNNKITADFDFGNASITQSSSNLVLIEGIGVSGYSGSIQLLSNSVAVVKIDDDPILSSAVDDAMLARIYPNPVRDQLHVMFSTDGPQNLTYTLRIFNAVGQPMYTTLVTSSETVINVNTWPSGLYFARIEHGGKAKVYQFIVE